MRAQRIEALFLLTASVAETCRRAREELSVSRATVCRVIAAARRRWASEATAEDRTTARADARARILADQARAREQGRLAVVLGYERLLCELGGLLIDRAEIVTARVDPLAGLSLAELRWVRDHGRLPDDDERTAIAALPAAKTNGNGGGN